MAYKIVDIDSHVAEPINLITDEYLEPQYRDRGLRIKKDEDGLEYLEIAGQKSKFEQGGVLAQDVGGFGKDLRPFVTPGEIDYEEGTHPAAVDPHARIKFMDEEGVDVTFLYPTPGIRWEAEMKDGELAEAYCRAYNNWLVDFCKPYPDRLIPVAHISLIDVDEAVKELKRTAKLGMKGSMIYSWPVNGKAYGDPYFDPFWAETQELDMPVAIHPVTNLDFPGAKYYPVGYTDGLWYITLMTYPDMLIGFTQFFQGAILERFPRLKLVVLEEGATWLPHWLNRMDDRYERAWFSTQMKLKPSEYFQRQCWIDFEPDEDLIAPTIKLLGADKFAWASDFPHTDGFPDTVAKVKERIKELPQRDQEMILGENALKIYNVA